MRKTIKQTLTSILLLCLVNFSALKSNAQANALYSWANGYGSTANDVNRGVATDASGNVYTVGYFGGDITALGITNAGGGLADIIIAKHNAAGVLQWAKGFGNTGSDVGYGIAVDANSNIYITGIFFGTVDFDPSTATANLTSASSSQDIFIAKYDATGNYLWAKGFGNTGNDVGNGIALDASSNVYITGYFTGTADFDPSAVVATLTSVGSEDIFMAKYDVNGNYVWAKNIGSSSSDQGNGIVIDASSNVYITGAFSGTADFDPSTTATANLTSAGSGDIFMAKYDSSGNYIWAKRFGNGLGDVGTGIAVDAGSNVYITGTFRVGVTFGPSISASSVGQSDDFIAKFDNSGNCIWGKGFGSVFIDNSYGIVVDASSNVYITGGFNGTVDFDPSTTGTVNLTSAGGADIFMAKYDASGNYVWAKRFGSSTNNDVGYGIAVDASENVYIAGQFLGTVDFDPSTSATANLISNGTTFIDLFVCKYSQCSSTTSTTNTSICTIALPYSWNGTTYSTAGTYTKTFTGGNSKGCDSVATLNLTINNATTSTNSATACGSYFWNGTTYTTSGAKTFSTTNKKGCDSTATLNLTINAATTSSTNATACGSYVWNGTTYTTSGAKTFSTTNSKGCDSVATLNLTVKTSSTSTTNIAICPSALPYNWDGLTFNAAGTQIAHLSNTIGCDSAATLVLTVNAAPPNISYVGVSGTYTIGTAIMALNPVNSGGTPTTSTVISTLGSGFHLPTGVAVDVAGNVYVADVGTKTVAKIVGNMVTTIGSGFKSPVGVAVDAAGTVYVADKGNANLPLGEPANGSVKKIVNGITASISSSANNIITYGVAVDAAGAVYAPNTLDYYVYKYVGISPYQIASGFSFPTGIAVDAAGTVVYVADRDNNAIKKITGSTVTSIGYGFNSPYGIAVDISGAVYIADAGNNAIKKIVGNTVTTLGSGFYSPRGVAVDAAGTVYVADWGNGVVKKMEFTSYTVSPALPTGLSLGAATGAISGTPKVATPATTYSIITQNDCGNDTATITFATICSATSATASTTTVSNCGNYTWNNIVYNTSGVYTKTGLTNAAGCDSTATLVLTVKEPTNSTTDMSVCSTDLPFMWNGITISGAGMYYLNLTNAAGCDSLTTLNLTVNQPTSSSENKQICFDALPYNWNGNIAYNWRLNEFHFTNVAGCDSTATLFLSELPRYFITPTVVGNGNIFVNAASIVCINQNSAIYSIVPNAGYVISNVLIDGISYGVINHYQFFNVTTNHTISASFVLACSPTTSTTSVSNCGSYIWNGTTYNTSGSYTIHLTNSCGSDSTATLNLTINQATTSTTTATACGSYVWNGATYTTSGAKTFSTTNAKGCDSTATLNLTINNATSSTSNASVCSNQLPYIWNGLTFNTAGTQTKTGLVNSKGCDSSATLVLSVSTSSPASISIASSANNVCDGVLVTFTATANNQGTAPIYQWKKNGVNVGNNSNTYSSATLANNDSVWCVLNSNSACATTLTAISSKIKMIIKANPGIGSSSTIGIICTIGGTTNVLNTNTLNGGVWTSDNTSVATVTTSAGANGIVKGISNGTALLTYTKTNSNGCALSAGTTITVAAVPTPAAIVITGATNLCVGQSTTLSNTTLGGVWSSLTNRASINATTGVVTGNNAGIASIQYKVTNAFGCSNSVTAAIPVNATPAIPSISYAVGTINPQTGAGTGNWCTNRTFTVVGSPTGGVWSSTGVITVNATTGAISTGNTTGATSLAYTVTNNGCSNSRTITANIVGCASRSSLQSSVNSFQSTDDSQQWTIYPNPARSTVSLNIERLVGAGTIVITDLYGKQAKKQALSMGTNSINISNLSKGFYLISTITTEGKITKKLVVE